MLTSQCSGKRMRAHARVKRSRAALEQILTALTDGAPSRLFLCSEAEWTHRLTALTVRRHEVPAQPPQPTARGWDSRTIPPSQRVGVCATSGTGRRVSLRLAGRRECPSLRSSTYDSDESTEGDSERRHVHRRRRRLPGGPCRGPPGAGWSSDEGAYRVRVDCRRAVRADRGGRGVSDARGDARHPEADWSAERERFLSQEKPRLRVSAPAKRYGWGIHIDSHERVGLVPVESAEYQRLAADPALRHVRAFRSKRA